MTVFLTDVFDFSMMPFEYVPTSNKITLEKAREMLKAGFVSAFRMRNTAEVASAQLGVDTLVSRRELRLNHGDFIMLFKLNKRIERNRVLTAEERASWPSEILLIPIVQREGGDGK